MLSGKISPKISLPWSHLELTGSLNVAHENGSEPHFETLSRLIKEKGDVGVLYIQGNSREQTKPVKASLKAYLKQSYPNSTVQIIRLSKPLHNQNLSQRLETIQVQSAQWLHPSREELRALFKDSNLFQRLVRISETGLRILTHFELKALGTKGRHSDSSGALDLPCIVAPHQTLSCREKELHPDRAFIPLSFSSQLESKGDLDQNNRIYTFRLRDKKEKLSSKESKVEETSQKKWESALHTRTSKLAQDLNKYLQYLRSGELFPLLEAFSSKNHFKDLEERLIQNTSAKLLSRLQNNELVDSKELEQDPPPTLAYEVEEKFVQFRNETGRSLFSLTSTSIQKIRVPKENSLLFQEHQPLPGLESERSVHESWDQLGLLPAYQKVYAQDRDFFDSPMTLAQVYTYLKQVQSSIDERSETVEDQTETAPQDSKKETCIIL